MSEGPKIIQERCPECKVTTPMIEFTLPGKEDTPRCRCVNCLKLFERKLTRKRRFTL